jgi:hypothetical protein
VVLAKRSPVIQRRVVATSSSSLSTVVFVDRGAIGGAITVGASILFVGVIAVAEVRARAFSQLGHAEALGLLDQLGAPLQPRVGQLGSVSR